MVGAPTSVAMSPSSSADAPAQARRQRWLSVLAKAAAVRLESGEVGIGYVGGRSARHAEIAAAVDALGRRPDWRDRLEAEIVAPLEAEADARRRAIAARAA